MGAYEADLAAELQERDCKISHLEEELSRLHRLSQVASKTSLRRLVKIRVYLAVVNADFKTKFISCLEHLLIA